MWKVLHEIVLDFWKKEVPPKDWIDAMIIKLFKKGDTTDCGNYRGISLLSIAGKILSNILLCRLNEITDDVVPETQCGFRKCRGTVDMMFCARQLIEKCKEQNRKLYMVFIDLSKAYDTVSRKLLWPLLRRYGVPEKLVNLIRSMHSGMEAFLRLDTDTTDKCKILNGLRQGCVLAPALFNLFYRSSVPRSLPRPPARSWYRHHVQK